MTFLRTFFSSTSGSMSLQLVVGLPVAALLASGSLDEAKMALSTEAMNVIYAFDALMR